MKGEEVSHYILFINSHEGREKRKVETRYNFFSAQDSHKWMWWKSQRVCNHRADFINHTDHRFALSFLLNRCSLSDRWAAGHTEMKQDDSASPPRPPSLPAFLSGSSVRLCLCMCVSSRRSQQGTQAKAKKAWEMEKCPRCGPAVSQFQSSAGGNVAWY